MVNMSDNYPIRCWVVLRPLWGRQMPAAAPAQARDPMKAYAAFLFDSEYSAKCMVAERDIKARGAWGCACAVHQDGSIELSEYAIAREDVFRSYGMKDDYAATAARSCGNG